MKSNSIANLGNTGLYVLTDLGRMTLFLFKAFRGIFRQPYRFKELVRQVNFIPTGMLRKNQRGGAIDHMSEFRIWQIYQERENEHEMHEVNDMTVRL